MVFLEHPKGLLINIKPFHQTLDNLLIVQPLLPMSTGFSLVGTYFYSVKLLFRIFLSLFEGETFHSLLVTRWNSLVARCSLQNITRYKLQTSLITIVAKAARCKKSPVTRCKFCPLLVAEVARCKKSLVTHCKIHSLLVVVTHWNNTN